MLKQKIHFIFVSSIIVFPLLSQTLEPLQEREAIESSNRHPVFYHALQCIAERENSVIVEIDLTKSTSNAFEIDRLSTMLFGNWARLHSNVSFFSVHRAPDSGQKISELAPNVHIIEDEPRSFLQQFDRKIDILYLCENNSMQLQNDYCELIRAAYRSFAKDAIVLFDGGRASQNIYGNRAVQFLLDRGYKSLLRGDQVLLSKLGSGTSKEQFSQIYENGSWGTYYDDDAKAYVGSSGTGSMPDNAKPYLDFLKMFVRENSIKSVVDVGCGDWQLSRFVDWQGIDYLGIDVVAALIDHHDRHFRAPNIQFLEADGTQIELPAADLLICKDVLQHLPLKDIHRFLKQLPKYKYALIVNDVDPSTCSSENGEIAPGEYRTLDLTAAPFYLNGEKVLSYVCFHEEVKVTLLWINPGSKIEERSVKD
jgi:SAM-dependent methyltransferase